MNLDDIQSIKNLDPHDITTSLKFFPQQCKQGWEKIHELDFNFTKKDIDNIVCCAMGGSLLGSRIAKHVFHEELEVPMHYYCEYSLPGYVSKRTLAIIVSTSGNTEETIVNYHQAKEKTNMIIGITSGGKFGPELKNDGTLNYIIDDHEYNPSGVPRVAVGFQIGAILAILSKLKFIEIDEPMFVNMLNDVTQFTHTITKENPINKNIAKHFASELKDKIPVIIASEHLVGIAKSFNNQMNESGKTFSAFFDLPEVNHHQLEGMQFPKANPNNLIYVLLESNLYNDRNKKRYQILKSILDKLSIQHISFHPNTESQIGQALESFQFGSYVSYYAGLLNGVDPAPNPYVDEFKKELDK